MIHVIYYFILHKLFIFILIDLYDISCEDFILFIKYWEEVNQKSSKKLIN
jgi:hypothetical protein